MGPKRAGAYWREECLLIALLFAFFAAVLVFARDLPFDARLFPSVIGTAGIVLVAGIAIEQLRQRMLMPMPSEAEDAAANADWPRFATALFSAPLFGVLFWLCGFVLASLAAMLLIPLLMGYHKRRHLLVIAFVTVAVLAL